MTPPTDRLALASEEDAATAADWERATAAVLRKSGRMREEEPDDLGARVPAGPGDCCCDHDV